MADADNSGEINYSEWVMTAIDRTKLLSAEKLESAFKMIDKDGSKTVSIEEVKGLLESLKILDEDLIKRAMKSVDIHRRGELTFHEF
jgi:calcium-dependent protein kinase